MNTEGLRKANGWIPDHFPDEHALLIGFEKYIAPQEALFAAQSQSFERVDHIVNSEDTLQQVTLYRGFTDGERVIVRYTLRRNHNIFVEHSFPAVNRYNSSEIEPSVGFLGDYSVDDTILPTEFESIPSAEVEALTGMSYGIFQFDLKGKPATQGWLETFAESGDYTFIQVGFRVFIREVLDGHRALAAAYPQVFVRSRS